METDGAILDVDIEEPGALLHEEREDSDSEDSGDDGSRDNQAENWQKLSWQHKQPPTEAQALQAAKDLNALLNPPRKKGHGYKGHGLDEWTRDHYKEIVSALHFYTSEKSPYKGKWGPAGDVAALAHRGKNSNKERDAKQVRRQAKAWVISWKLPANPYGKWTCSVLEKHEGFAEAVNMHLQGVGKYVQAHDIITYLNKEEVKAEYGLAGTVSPATSKRWMKTLGYRW
ncbi:hypothetical protein EDD18DRAFT_1062257, partial [Armillaria luteobubalina]